MVKTREEILERLNGAQREVATKIDGKYAVIAGPGSGKSLVNTTTIQTPNRPVLMGDIQVDQEVFGTDGKIYEVEGVYPQGLKDIWEVEFSEGTVIEACEDHLWTFQQRKNRRRQDHRRDIYETMTTREIYEGIDLYKTEGKSDYKAANVYMPDVLPVQYEEKDFSLDPYFLGLLLGDGSFRHNNIRFSNAEEDILNKFNKEIESYGNRIVNVQRTDYEVRSDVENTRTIKNKIKELGLEKLYSFEKFIPEQYLYGSIEQRLDLLKGLIDTDGYCSGSSYEYTTSSEELSKNVKFLVQSLGMTAAVSVKEEPTYIYKGETKIGKPSYRIVIKPSKTIKKIHTSKKHESAWKKGQSSARITITDIRPTTKQAEMTCITVSSPDSLFLVEDYIPTHNTFSMISRAEYLISSGIKPWEILMITFTKKAAGEISERLLSTIGAEAVELDTGTFHSIALRIILSNQAILGYDKDLTVIDQDESMSLISDLAASHGFSSKEGGREIKDFIENWQMEGLSPLEVENLNKYPQDIVVIYEEYQKIKKQIGYIDFNDILNLSVFLLENYPNIREKYARQYKHIIVDSSATL